MKVRVKRILRGMLGIDFSSDHQTSLVRQCWSELFTLGLAQCSDTMNLPTILAAIMNHLQSSVQQGT